MKRFDRHPLRWLGTLLTPAEDPRRGATDAARPPDAGVLLAELRRSRGELSQLRQQLMLGRSTETQLTLELAEQEQELLEAEQSLLLSLDERQARSALLAAKYLAAEAQVRTDFL